MRSAVTACWAMLSPWMFLAQTASAQNASEAVVVTDAPKQVRAVRISVPPVIDGNLNDPVWEQAEVITDFHQTRPGNGT
ncbi:MAG TPA: hypothetical protein DD407_07480, partial [Pseudohongiella sp.]|nr:hypothetical protein [Pseudohongiella sp.]